MLSSCIFVMKMSLLLGLPTVLLGSPSAQASELEEWVSSEVDLREENSYRTSLSKSTAKIPSSPPRDVILTKLAEHLAPDVDPVSLLNEANQRDLLGTISRNSPRFWRSSSEISSSPHSPLSGLRVVIDPGHIGGKWASREGRLFVSPCGVQIAEGDMTLRVAIILKKMLTSAGAKVSLTRYGHSPLNGDDPTVFRSRAIGNLRKNARPTNEVSIRRESTRILVQQAEIESRAHLINEVLRPDLVICLHFNAEPWGTASSPKLSPRNHFHILIGGHYKASELSNEEQKINLFRRVLEGTHAEEVLLSKVVAEEVARSTGLPPFNYGTGSKVASPVDGTPYVWKRNLMATRLFQCPVVFLEPFVMNNQEFVNRVRQAENAWMTVSKSPDVFEQYAQGVFAGVLRHYSSSRPPSGPLPLIEESTTPRWLDKDQL